METLLLRHAIQTSHEVDGFYALSFYGDNDLSVSEIVQLAQLPHGKIRVSNVGALRNMDLEPLRSPPYPHLLVKFDICPSDDELEEITRLFALPIPSPRVVG